MNNRTNLYPDTATSRESQKPKKWIGFFLILIVLISISIGFLYFQFQKQSKNLLNKSPVTLNQNKVSKPNLSKTEIAKTALNWLDSQRNENGLYHFSCQFNNKTCHTCEPSALSQREGAFIVWGRYKYFQKTNSSENLQKIEEELGQLATKPLNFEDVNCRMLLDLWLDKNIPSSIKSLAEKTCLNDGRSGDSDYGNISPQVASKSIANIPSDLNKIINNGSISIDPDYTREPLKKNYIKNAFFASEDIAKNIVLKTSTPTKTYTPEDPLPDFSKALYGYYLQKEARSIYGNSVLGISALDLYDYTHQKLYLDFALFLFNENNKLSENINDYKDLIYRGLFDQHLFKTTKDAKYKKESEAVISRLINTSFDSVLTKNLKGGCGGFVNPSSDFYSAKDNGLIIGLILND